MDLIKITPATIGGEPVQTVNARELHDFLGVGARFSDWIKERISAYGFVQGRDFLTEERRVGARLNVLQIDYHLTLDMAKELAMVERNEAGKRARLYFIECERRATTPPKPRTSDPLSNAKGGTP